MRGYSVISQALDMSHNKLEKSGAVRLQVFLVKATSLTHLNLSNCCLGTDGMIVSSFISNYVSSCFYGTDGTFIHFVPLVLQYIFWSTDIYCN